MPFDVAAALREHGNAVARYFDELLPLPLGDGVGGGAPGACQAPARFYQLKDFLPDAGGRNLDRPSGPPPLPPPSGGGGGNAIPPRLVEAIRYSLDAGGKRLRPALVLEAFAAAAAPSADRSAAVAAAAAMELVHTFSLVHDDLPAMDDDDLRRGRPTNHKVFGEALAILAGDAMMTLAFEVLASVKDAETSRRLTAELARAAGPAGMIGGQVLDMAAEGVDSTRAQLEQIHRMKTAALLSASLRMGAIAGGASDDIIAALGIFGREMGLAFQITDDLLDETATPEELGKAVKKDAGRGKTTYPRLLGHDGSRAAAAAHTAAAINVLDTLGKRGARLKALAEFVLTRSS